MRLPFANATVDVVEDAVFEEFPFLARRDRAWNSAFSCREQQNNGGEQRTRIHEIKRFVVYDSLGPSRRRPFVSKSLT